MENSIKTLEVVPTTGSNGHGSNGFSGIQASWQSISISQLRAAVKGRVITPEDADYDAARIRLNLEYIRRPALIVRPVDEYDVSYVVSLARKTGMELAVRSGGHSLPGFSTVDDGIALDLSSMKGLEVDVEQRTAWAEAGLTGGEYTVMAAEYGLATGFGDTASVGIGGLTTGGGIGYLVRKCGLTIDNLLAVQIVTADGQIRYVDAETHPDLFWAIRGGGGNFGVITKFKFRLHPVNIVAGGMLILPAKANVMAAFAAAAEAAPDELSTIVYTLPAPPEPFIPEEYHGQIVMLAKMVYAGDIDEGMRVIEPFRHLAEPIVDMLGPMPYHEIYWPAPVDGTLFTLRSKFLDKFDERTAQIMLDQLYASPANITIAEFRILGGAMARVPADATAFAHRSARVFANFIIQFENHDDRPFFEAWVVKAIAALDPGNGVYINFVGNEGKARLHDAYPRATLERLAAIKARYDPTNLFRRNHNIAPKAS